MPDDRKRATLPPLLPTPKIVRAREGSFELRDRLPIVLPSGVMESDLASAIVLRDEVRRRCSARCEIEAHARSDDLGPCIDLRRRGDTGEDYRIAVDTERIEVSAAGPAGLRYAVETLCQLIEPRASRGRRERGAAQGRVPGCFIDDAPDLGLRGIMLDVSRGKVPKLETLRGLVDLCVRLKLNALMLYVEHTFRFRRHPRIGSGASPLDAETLLELDAYARARHVDLIPSLQSLGHMEHILRIPAYVHLAETDLGWTISPAEPGTYELLAELYAEFLPNFRSRWFNANCDEPHDLGRGKSLEWAQEAGTETVYLEHVKRVRELARSYGKRTMIWGDVVHSHPDRIPDIDRHLALLDWWYEAKHDYDRVKRFADNGLEFVVCPGTSTWNCLFPRVPNSLENITGYAEAGKRHGALGLIVTDWGDFGHYNLLGNSWFAYAWAAQQAWSGRVGAREFDRACARQVFDDASGETAHLYRELGAIHEAGFQVENASALQFLYFDDLDRAFFVEGAKVTPLRRSLRKLEELRPRIAAAKKRYGRESLTWEEMLLAADASRLAVRKALAGRRYVAWRRRRGRLEAAARRTLARELAKLADEQTALGRTLRRLWLRRSHASNFEITQRRLDRSIVSLRRAARALRSGRRPAPPPPHPGFDTASVFAALKESAGA